MVKYSLSSVHDLANISYTKKTHSELTQFASWLFFHRFRGGLIFIFWYIRFRTFASDWQVDLGVHSRSANELNQRAYAVSEMHIHDNYSASTLESDIAILRFNEPVEENSDVQPICVTSLPISDFYGQQCVVTGWGTTTESKFQWHNYMSLCIYYR